MDRELAARVYGAMRDKYICGELTPGRGVVCRIGDAVDYFGAPAYEAILDAAAEAPDDCDLVDICGKKILGEEFHNFRCGTAAEFAARIAAGDGGLYCFGGGIPPEDDLRLLFGTPLFRGLWEAKGFARQCLSDLLELAMDYYGACISTPFSLCRGLSRAILAELYKERENGDA